MGWQRFCLCVGWMLWRTEFTFRLRVNTEVEGTEETCWLFRKFVACPPWHWTGGVVCNSAFYGLQCMLCWTLVWRGGCGAVCVALVSTEASVRPVRRKAAYSRLRI